MPGWTWEQEPLADRLIRIYGPQDPLERASWLDERADNLEMDAKRLEGVSWAGDIPPSHIKQIEADLLREHAALLRLTL